MNVFDFVFIACFLAAVVSLLRTAWYAWHRRWAIAARTLRRLGYGFAAYSSVLVVVSLSSRPRILPMRESLCFDDWCVSVERCTVQQQIGRPPGMLQAQGIFYLVTVRVSNAGRRAAQRATDAAVWLVDSKGRRCEPSPPGQQLLDSLGESGPELTTKIKPGGSFERNVVFDIPNDAVELRLGVSHGYFPGVIIIGDRNSFLHEPVLFELKVPREL